MDPACRKKLSFSDLFLFDLHTPLKFGMHMVGKSYLGSIGAPDNLILIAWVVNSKIDCAMVWNQNKEACPSCTANKPTSWLSFQSVVDVSYKELLLIGISVQIHEWNISQTSQSRFNWPIDITHVFLNAFFLSGYDWAVRSKTKVFLTRGNLFRSLLSREWCSCPFTKWNWGWFIFLCHLDAFQDK